MKKFTIKNLMDDRAPNWFIRFVISDCIYNIYEPINNIDFIINKLRSRTDINADVILEYIDFLQNKGYTPRQVSPGDCFSISLSRSDTAFTHMLCRSGDNQYKLIDVDPTSIDVGCVLQHIDCQSKDLNTAIIRDGIPPTRTVEYLGKINTQPYKERK